MAISALLTIICDFEANAIGISEKGRPIVGSILGVKLRLRSCDTKGAKLTGNGDNVSD